MLTLSRHDDTPSDRNRNDDEAQRGGQGSNGLHAMQMPAPGV